MKRVFAFLLAVIMVFFLCACAAQQNPVLSEPDTTPDQSEASSPSTSTEPTVPSISTEPTDPTVNSDPTQPSVPTECQHELEVFLSQDASCTEPGCVSSKCVLCEKVFAVETPALGHSFNDATCVRAKTCAVCGVTEGNPLGHHYVSGKCDRCGDKLPDEVPTGCAHDYRVSDQKAPTCTASGSITYKCSKCSHSYTDGTCSRCGAADPSVPVEVTYTVTVRTDKGAPVEGVTVSVYTADATPAATGKTNGKGVAAMTLLPHDSYKIVLSNVPANYIAKESYTFRSTTVNINLTSVSYITPTDHSNANYKVGSTMGDFTLTDTDGISYTLSELLKEKDLVILSFWFVTCEPCKSEFPYLEAVHKNYADRVQLLTLNHFDSEQSIKDLRQQMEVTFPMIWENIGFQKGFDIFAYPTTVFIDGDGKILKIHTGAYRTEQELTSLIDGFLR